MAKKEDKRNRDVLPQHVPDKLAALHFLKVGKIDEFIKYSGLPEDKIDEALQHYKYKRNDDSSNTNE